MKELKPHKLVVHFENGLFREGIYLYKIIMDGKWDGKYRSTTIKNFPFSKPLFNQMLVKVRKKTKELEGINEEVL